MERDWLQARLADGDSFEAIAREAGCHPSTVSYWARRHGLTSVHADRHAARGAVDRELLEEIVALRVSVRDIAEVLGRSPTTIRHWLRRYGLETARTARMRVAREPLPEDTPPGTGRCPDHGVAPFVRDRDGRSRCRKCRVDGVVRRRERLSAVLVAEAGGACAICGFDAPARRCTSTTSIRPARPSRSATATPDPWTGCARKRANASSFAPTVMRRSRPEPSRFP